MTSTAMRALLTIGSTASIGFGIWHFFVPRTWDWYSYIAPEATELVLAVRTINILFSLCLVLFGLLNGALALADQATSFPIVVVMVATVILWTTRVVLQVVFPQGSSSAALQYGMLTAFVVILACHLVPLIAAARVFVLSH
jgi:NAD/NADP transhydrogenase beta subunit